MLKKCLLAIAVVSLLAVTVQADTAEYKGDPWPWPIKWKGIEVCEFPVFIEIGYWIEIKDCQDLEIILVQTPCSETKSGEFDADDYPCYEGCEKVKIRTNFEAEIKLDFDDAKPFKDLIDDDEPFWHDPPNDADDEIIVQPTGDDWLELEACLNISADLWEVEVPSRAGEKSHLGKMEIEVVPTADIKDLIIKPWQP